VEAIANRRKPCWINLGALLGTGRGTNRDVVCRRLYAAASSPRLAPPGHHLVTRVRSNAVAYFPAPPARPNAAAGTPPMGAKPKLHDWFGYAMISPRPASPVYGETGVRLRFTPLIYSGAAGRLVRFVWVIHPTRGRLVLLATDLDALPPLEIIRLLAGGLKSKSVSSGHSQPSALCLPFLDADMKPIRRGDGDQHPASAAGKLPGASAPQAGRLRTPHPVGAHRQACCNIWRSLSAGPSGANFHTYIRTAAPQKPPRNGWSRMPCAIPAAILAVLPESSLSRNSLLKNSAPTGCGYAESLDTGNAHETYHSPV